jgi:cyclopropane fatty-acyl-phospholipid synthase-like methyltransferase
MTEHERRARAEQRERFDFAVIAGWIPPGERVLDLGCGDGRLLRYLNETRTSRATASKSITKAFSVVSATVST